MQQSYVPSDSKKARQIAQAKGSRFYYEKFQTPEILAWNAKVEADKQAKKVANENPSKPN